MTPPVMGWPDHPRLAVPVERNPRMIGLRRPRRGKVGASGRRYYRLIVADGITGDVNHDGLEHVRCAHANRTCSQPLP